MIKGFNISILIFVSCSALQAGNSEKLVFSPTGRRIEVKRQEEIPAESLSMETKLAKTCVEFAGKKCFRWDLGVLPADNVVELLPRILAGLNIWSASQNLNLAFAYNGITHTPGIPYTMAGNNIALDQYENEIVTGNFLISFLPPEGLLREGTVSTTVKYIIPNLETGQGSLEWGGIYLKADLKTSAVGVLEKVIANEVGNILGLGPTANQASRMYPLQAAGMTGFTLSPDDLATAQSLYSAGNFLETKGSLSGEVIFGDDGSKLPGVNLELIPLDRLEAFARSADRSNARYSTFSREEGRFKFEAIEPGEYFLLVESLASGPLPLNIWDDWTLAFASREAVMTEFYDGAERESNREAAGTFSPALIYYAAALQVRANDENRDVQVVSNSSREGVSLINANGASHERLSDYVGENQETRKFPSEAMSDNSISTGGCRIAADETNPRAAALFLLIGLSIVFSLLRRSKRLS